MASALNLDRGRVVLHGTVAGIAGGVLIDAFVYVTSLLPQHASVLSLWQFVASTAVGKVAYTSSSYAWLGLAMHLAVSIAWGVGYVYLANVQPGLRARPALSGVVFGLVVYVVMQLAVYSVGDLQITSGMEVVFGIIAHCLFFGLPVALVARAQMRA